MSSRSRFHRTQCAKDKEEQVMRKLLKRISAVAGATVLAGGRPAVSSSAKTTMTITAR